MEISKNIDPNTIVQVVTVFVMIISIVITVVWSIKQMRSSTYSSIMNRMFELNKIELTNDELFNSLLDSLDAKNPCQRQKYHYLFMLFSVYNEIFMQRYSGGLLSKREYDSWERRFANLLRHKPSVNQYWYEYYRYDASQAFNYWFALMQKGEAFNKRKFMLRYLREKLSFRKDISLFD